MLAPRLLHHCGVNREYNENRRLAKIKGSEHVPVTRNTICADLDLGRIPKVGLVKKICANIKTGQLEERGWSSKPAGFYVACPII